MFDPAVVDLAETRIAVALEDGQIDRAFAELTLVTAVVASSQRLARILSDPDLDSAGRATLINDLAQSRLLPTTVQSMISLGDLTSASKPLAALAYSLTAQFGFASAEAHGVLEKVRTELDEVAQLLRDNSSFTSTLSDPGIPQTEKTALISDVFSDKVDTRTLQLLQLTLLPRSGRDMVELVLELSSAIAARTGRVVAEVRTAVSLDEERRVRLVEALSASLGKAVEGRFRVDPSIGGSVVVRVGDDVYDGSLRRRLNDARKELAGA